MRTMNRCCGLYMEHLVSWLSQVQRKPMNMLEKAVYMELL